MNSLEKQMVELLIDLRENYSFVGIKAEFEHEGARMDEMFRLKEITMEAGLGITMKIGGCEAVTNLYDSRTIGVQSIVAPMVESPFAVKKFLSAVNEVYSEEELSNVSLFLNVESIQGYHNFEQMLALPEFERVGGVTVGRGDMACSMGLERSEVNADSVFEVCSTIFRLTKERFPQKECILGGVGEYHALGFLSRFPKGMVDSYEGRKAMFAVTEGWEEKARLGLAKGLEFEILWYENKSRRYGAISNEDHEYLDRIRRNYSRALNA